MKYMFKDFNDLKQWAAGVILRELLNGSLTGGVDTVLATVLSAVEQKILYPK